MSEPVVIPPGGGEVVGDSPDRRVEILSDHEALHATWSRFGPRREGADLHIHRRHTDLFYVLAGELTVRLGREGEPVAVQPGTLVRVPPYVVHGFRNETDGELRYLNLHAPGTGFADYMRGLRDGRRVPFDQEPPPADGVRPASEAAIGEIAHRVDRLGLHASLLADVDEIAVADITSEPGDRPPLHVHRHHAESFYVLEGEVALTGDGRELRAPAGTWVQVPAGVPHTVAAAGGGPARYLNLHTPNGGFGAFLRGDPAAFDEAPPPPAP